MRKIWLATLLLVIAYFTFYPKPALGTCLGGWVEVGSCGGHGICTGNCACGCGGYVCPLSPAGYSCNVADGKCRTYFYCGNNTTQSACTSVAGCWWCNRETDAAFCSRLGKNCGTLTANDNCGIQRTVNCGTCTAPQVCINNVCGCPPTISITGAITGNPNTPPGQLNPARVCTSNNTYCSSPLPPSVLTGLIAYWNMNETTGTTISDPYGNNAGTTINTTISEGIGSGRWFNGTNSQINFNTTIGNLRTSNFTIAGWIKTSAANGYIISKRGTCGLDNFISMQVAGEKLGAEVCQASTGTTNYIGFVGNKKINDNLWHHVAMVRSGNTLHLYVDGVLDGSKSGGSIADINNSYTLQMGVSPCNPRFTGILDEFGIWSRALTETEIQSIYHARGYTLPVPNNNSYTLTASDISEYSKSIGSPNPVTVACTTPVTGPTVTYTPCPSTIDVTGAVFDIPDGKTVTVIASTGQRSNAVSPRGKFYTLRNVPRNTNVTLTPTAPDLLAAGCIFVPSQSLANFTDCATQTVGPNFNVICPQPISDAGAVFAKGTTINPGKGRVSQNGADVIGYRSPNYTPRIADITYTTLLNNVLKNAGLGTYKSLDTLLKSGAGGPVPRIIADGKYYLYSYYDNDSFESALLAAAANMEAKVANIIIPRLNSDQTAPAIQSVSINMSDISLATNYNNRGSKTVVFINGNLTVNKNIFAGDIFNSIVFILNNSGPKHAGDLSVDPTVHTLGGLYIFPGTFYDGGGENVLTGRGSLIATGNYNLAQGFTRFSDFTRSLGVVWYYQPKYLLHYKNLLATPIYTWSEKLPQQP